MVVRRLIERRLQPRGDIIYSLGFAGSVPRSRPSKIIRNALAHARRNRVWIETAKSALASGLLPTDVETDTASVLAEQGAWNVLLRQFADEFFAKVQEAGCRCVLIKGFALQDMYERAFGAGVERDLWDIDCCLASFEDFWKLASLAEEMGGHLAHLTLRADGERLAGSADIRFLVADQFFPALSIECLIGGQPLSRSTMRRHDDTLWTSVKPLDGRTAPYVCDTAHALAMLAGEITENRGLILRDYIDYTAILKCGTIRWDLATISELGSALVNMEHRMRTYARKNKLPEVPLIPGLEALRSKSPHATDNRPDNLAVRAYTVARNTVRRTKSDRLASVLGRVFHTSGLWAQGCYIDTLRLNRRATDKDDFNVNTESGVASTPLGDFLLVPFGIVTQSEINALHALPDTVVDHG